MARVQYPSSVREGARALRADGESIKRIASALGISQGTASLWCRDVSLTDEQRAALDRRQQHSAVDAASVAADQRRRKWADETELLWTRHRSDPFFLLGIGIYWGEGRKRLVRGRTGRLCLSNSDPSMMR